MTKINKFETGDEIVRASKFRSWAPKGYKTKVLDGYRYRDNEGDINCIKEDHWEVASLNDKIAELKRINSELLKRLHNSQADKLDAIAKERKRWAKEDLKALEVLKLEQQAKSLIEFKFKRSHTQTILEKLSDDSYSQEDHDLVYEELKAVEIILSNKANELIGEAKALMEQASD